MLLRLIILAAVITTAFAGRAESITGAQLSRALHDLDVALRHNEDYQNKRRHYIDSLSELNNANPSPGIVLQIADSYISFNNDSALNILTREIDRADGEDKAPFRWRRASILPVLGFPEYAMQEYQSIDTSAIQQDCIAEYLEAGRQMYSYISSFYRDLPSRRQQYDDSVRLYQQRLLDVLLPRSYEYRFIQAEYYLMTGRSATAKVLLEEMLTRLPWSHKLKARTAHHLSTIANEEGDSTAYLYYLALSARADVEQATREVLSLQELGSQLSSTDLERAHNYTNQALRNAVECGAMIRTVDTSQALPVIERAHSESISRWRHVVYAIITGMALLLVGLVVMLFVLRREMNELRLLQQRLRQANHAKEVYISRFLQLCSAYMNKLKHFSNVVERKLAAGRSEELYNMAKSGKFVDEQSRDFYNIFDDAFLHIFPNFVADVNALLREDGKIVLKEGEMLNTELRILAFMRLGIDESAHIARVLNYSLNTIYAYRNRLKMRAVNRDAFEDDIAKIESLD